MSHMLISNLRSPVTHSVLRILDTLANVARVPTPQEQSLADNYGIGFDIAEKMGWSVLAEHKDPIQLRSQTTRAGCLEGDRF